MAEYKVVLRIDIDADSPIEAAKTLESLVREETLVYDVFCVEDDDEHGYVSVDFCEEEDDACSMPAPMSQGIEDFVQWLKG